MEAVGKWIGCGIVLLAGRSGDVLQGKMETDSWERENFVVSGVSSSLSSSSFPAPALSDRSSSREKSSRFLSWSSELCVPIVIATNLETLH